MRGPRVGHIKQLVVRRKAETVGLVALIGDEVDLPRPAVDAVHGFLQFERRQVPFVIRQDAVARVREPYTPVRMHHDVIGSVEWLALPALRQDGQRSVMFEADHAPSVVLAGKQAAFPIKRAAIGVVGRTTEDADVAIFLEPAHLHVARNITENEVAPAAIPCGPFGPEQPSIKPLDGCAPDFVFGEPFVQNDDVWIRVMNGGLPAPITLPRSRGRSAGAPVAAPAG